ncbi:hypothetical protein ACSS6W_008142 [Trichoderma asperelloides]|uniref:Cyanovirin-N domain-containing protein n=1 Tax=Trichoderma asperellum (strain ATCC 204424 / CBS 433.97 / NBRC 101777) TaxID=1042311 RepID=A0A2T3YRQ4_TRIA4|nr:hypothetical protein M441DRAFT_41504 [Trichoderma asperellum CBS 433.97]KAH8122465.1 hypothetical protein LI328DRAFT_170534 [Trichoderma asperelloides]PTB35248.1 hypothetical protein M441DRAFT_41504 [Trichoderma asperellum CBS 433.97]UKZ96553.1 hypothetical protein TrAFT101_011336 [Trichoderma asperellum]
MRSYSFLLGLLAIPAALAADCYGSGNPGLPASDFQQVADQVCNVGPDASAQFGNNVIQAHYEGNAKIHCRDAFSNIISQCVGSRNGGQWTWNYNGVQELYYIQAITL